MSVNVYMGVGGIPKELNGVYVGVNGAVKEVQEIYVGVGGVPKLVWQNGLSYTYDLVDVNPGTAILGTVSGRYTRDGNHIVGSAVVTGYYGDSKTKYLFIPLPIKLTAGSALGGEYAKSAVLKVYNSTGDRVNATYSTETGGDLSYLGRYGFQCVRGYNSTGWDYNCDRMELEFDYYIKGE